MVAAFIGDEIRGVARALIAPDQLGGGYGFLMMVYSNQAENETFTFKFYDSDIDEVVDLVETIDWEVNMIIGDLINSFIFHTPSNEVTTNIELETGWNWFSLNVLSNDMSVNNVLSSVDGSMNYIKNIDTYAEYYDSYGWWGTLEAVNNAEMYKATTLNSDIIEFTALPVNPSDVQIEELTLPRTHFTD